jgi:hypothetical protein
MEPRWIRWPLAELTTEATLQEKSDVVFAE